MSSSNQPTPDVGSSSFLALPAELRNRIYYYALADNQDIAVFQDWKLQDEPRTPHYGDYADCQEKRRVPNRLSLSQTCRQVRAEASGVFIGNTNFDLRPLTGVLNSSTTPYFPTAHFERFMSVFGKNLAVIRHLTLDSSDAASFLGSDAEYRRQIFSHEGGVTVHTDCPEYQQELLDHIELDKRIRKYRSLFRNICKVTVYFQSLMFQPHFLVKKIEFWNKYAYEAHSPAFPRLTEIVFIPEPSQDWGFSQRFVRENSGVWVNAYSREPLTETVGHCVAMRTH